MEKISQAYLVFKNIHFEKIHQLWKLAELATKEEKEILNFEEEFILARNVKKF